MHTIKKGIPICMIIQYTCRYLFKVESLVTLVAFKKAGFDRENRFNRNLLSSCHPELYIRDAAPLSRVPVDVASSPIRIGRSHNNFETNSKLQ